MAKRRKAEIVSVHITYYCPKCKKEITVKSDHYEFSGGSDSRYTWVDVCVECPKGHHYNLIRDG